jgi:hypothetical protein
VVREEIESAGESAGCLEESLVSGGLEGLELGAGET